MSTNGAYLYKCKVDSEGRKYGYINMLCDSGVTLVNNLEDITEFPKNINYSYYIHAARKIIDSLNVTQLSLF